VRRSDGCLTVMPREAALSTATTTDAGTLPPSAVSASAGAVEAGLQDEERGCRAKRSPAQSCELVPLIDTLGFRSSDYTEKKSTYPDSFLLTCQLAKAGRNAPGPVEEE
jgi:hypothetical protein